MSSSRFRRLPQVAALAAALLSAYPVLAQSTYVFRGPLKGLAVSTGLPAARLSGASLAFGSVDVGQSATPRTVTLTNTGDVSMTLTGAPEVSGSGFSLQSTTCGASLAPAASCSVTVGFAPVADGLASGSLSFGTNAAGSPHTVSLSGTGLTYPGAALSSTQMAFGAVNVGATSDLSVRLTNNGTAVLQLSSAPALSGNAAFSFPAGAGTSCGATLAVNAFCDTTVRFTPSQVSAVTGTLSFATNASGSPLEVSLSGSGLQAVGALAAASGSSTDFGAVSVGGQATQNFVFSNTGNTSATGVKAAVTGSDLTLVSNTCGTQASPVTVAAGSTCTVSVRYSPSAAGSLSGSLSVTSSAANSPSSLSLTGSAAFAGRTVQVSPAVSGQTYWNLDSQPLVLSTAGTYTVTPMGNFNITLKSWGGGGAGNGGTGGFAGGTVAATTSDTFVASLPAKGGSGGSNLANGSTGWSGGAYAGVFRSSVSLANALVVAGGGGGAGGAAGGSTGSNGWNTANCGVTMYGFGGTQSAGGAAGTQADGAVTAATPGAALTGGTGATMNNSVWSAGTGGGAGYYGGGGGAGGGSCQGTAGGGSSFVALTLSSRLNSAGTSNTTPGNSADADRGTGGNTNTLVGRIVLR